MVKYVQVTNLRLTYTSKAIKKHGVTTYIYYYIKYIAQYSSVHSKTSSKYKIIPDLCKIMFVAL